jgi:hypothetical protein
MSGGHDARQIGGGLSRFVLSADPIKPDRINVYEIWETDEQLEAFRGADPSAGQAAWIHGVDVRRYRIASVEAGHEKIILYANPGTESLYRRLGFPRMKRRWRSGATRQPPSDPVC